MATREYKLNFGIVKVTIEGDNCTATYQNNGEFSGTIKDNVVKAKWTNEGKEGLIELDLSDNKLVGKWKQGLEEGPMRGKWEGVIVNSNDNNQSTEKTNPVLSLNQIIEKIKVDCKDHESIDEIINDLSDNNYLDHWAKQLIDNENNNIKEIAKQLYLRYTQNLEDPSFNDYNTIAQDFADESLFNDSNLATDFYKKAENSAESSGDFASMAKSLMSSNKDWAYELQAKAENLAESLDEFVDLADKLIDHDKHRALGLFKKAENLAVDVEGFKTIWMTIRHHDKEWTIELCKKAEKIATSFDDYDDIAYIVMAIDKDWGKKLYEKASNHASELSHFNIVIKNAFYDFEEHQLGKKMANKAIRALMDTDNLFEFCEWEDLIELADYVSTKDGEKKEYLTVVVDPYRTDDGIGYGLDDKESAKTIFNKIKEYLGVTGLLEGGRKVIEVYGLDDSYTQEFCNQVIERAIELNQREYYYNIYAFIRDSLQDEDRTSDFYSVYEEEILDSEDW